MFWKQVLDVISQDCFEDFARIQERTVSVFFLFALFCTLAPNFPASKAGRTGFGMFSLLISKHYLLGHSANPAIVIVQVIVVAIQVRPIVEVVDPQATTE